MGKVIIDYENFKDVLRDYLAEHLIEEIISCMNDNNVFIEDIDEEPSGNENKEAFYTLLTTEEAMREVKCNRGAYNIKKMYIEKEHTAKKLGCKHYIHCEMEDLYLFYLTGQGFKPIIGNGGAEYVITADNYLIDVTGNSLYAIEKEVCLGTVAYGYMGIVEDLWHTNNYEKMFSSSDFQQSKMTVFDLLRNITSVKSFATQIFSLMRGIKSEEELLEKITREFLKEQAVAVIATAKEGYPLSLEGLQK